MNVFKKVKFLDSISSMLVSALLCILLYKILYPICHYTGIRDFYSGTTVFENHNKILDIVIYFIYLSLFFAVLPLITTIREKFLPDCRFFIDKFVTISKRISNKLTFPEKLSKFFAKYQIITVIFYILLYPFDGNFYPMVSGIIVLLIVAALIDVKKRSNSEYKISPWTLAPLILALLFKNYYIPAAPVDDHHLGETFSTFFMHDKYNLQYYKDIMLMHGYTDILPAFFGKYLFGDSNLYSYCLGGVFFDNLKLLAIIISGLYFFKKTPLFVAPLLIVNFSFPHVYNSCLYMVSFLLLLQKKILKKPLLWLVLYLILCFAGFVYWTTFGTFWIISSLPIAGYVLWKSNKKLVNFSVLALLFFILLFINKNFIFNFLEYFLEYSQGNIYAFGNNFGGLTLKNIVLSVFNMFALLSVPFFILEITKGIKKHSSPLLIFMCLFPVISACYTLVRIDNNSFARCKFLSIAYLAILLPFFLYKKYPYLRNNLFKLILLLILFFGLIFSFKELPNKYSNLIYEKPRNYTSLYNTGNINIDSRQQKRLEGILEFIKTNSGEHDVYYDITNRGMNYFYFDKKIPVQFVSYYNSISSKQDKISLEKLKKNPPRIVLISSNNLYYDEIPPSIRINEQYRWLLSSGYKLTFYAGSVFLLKEDKDISDYTQEELYILDDILSSNYLYLLPEVWAESINTLPIEEIEADYTYKIISPYESKIIFNKPISIKQAELLYFNPQFEQKFDYNNYSISIDDNKSILYCRSNTGKILISLDNYASWFLNKEIKQITIKQYLTENKKINSLKNAEIKFYKKSF